MKSEQICYLLLETTQNQDISSPTDQLESFQVGLSNLEDEQISSRLHQILHTLQEQKNDFIAGQQKQHQTVIEKINFEKDQIIEDLVKSIYNLKKQNEQLRFQYRKRFKVIKNIEEKYEKLIIGKNNKISELDSVVRYLEGKIKHLQKQLGRLETQTTLEISTNKGHVFLKSPQNYQSPQKITAIVSKEKLKSDTHSHLLPRNSNEDSSIPTASSFMSLNDLTSCSKTIKRNRSKGKYEENFVSSFQDPKQSNAYSFLLTPSVNSLNQKCLDSDINFDDKSRIIPSMKKHHSVSTSRYLDFTDVQRNDIKSIESSVTNTQRTSHCISRDRWSFLREKY